MAQSQRHLRSMCKGETSGSGFEGVNSPLSSGANRNLINSCRIVLSMYGQKKIDPFTGAPVSKATMTAAYNIITAFNLIENQKK
ncbi:hypothetical protein [Flavobacterium sp. ov086]|uniref:hypothetical protein n=1 Tax=Flavobacterium sp. ov086 TaxID=1761785 RepID=UPI000B6635A0|nr:hypothetical protein [Flavobacterium sp. ov086]SNS04879.1 hypothetical protein SAMN04487979_1561 [Flavobacterium sp. ov086]